MQGAEEAQHLLRVFSCLSVASAIFSALGGRSGGFYWYAGKELGLRMTKWGAGSWVRAAVLDLDLAIFFLTGQVRNRQEEL